MKKILITGLPGVGKTTLIKKICNKLNAQGITCSGFYTEEIRKNDTRIGFDIVTLDGNRAPLARKSFPTSDQRLPRVGQYVVLIDEFEKLALPIIENPRPGFIIIDEIGKMELFSEKFKNSIATIMNSKNVMVIATVPVKSNCPLVVQLKQDKEFELITVTTTNRNDLEVILERLVRENN